MKLKGHHRLAPPVPTAPYYHNYLLFQVEEQCGPLNALNRSQVIFALNQTLLQAENVRLGLAKPTFSTDELIRLYRTGELDAFYFKQDALLYPHLR